MKPGAISGSYGKASRKSPIALIAIAVVVVLAVGLGAGWYFVWSVVPPQEVAKTYLTAMAKMDLDTMVTCVAEKDRDRVQKLKGRKGLSALAKPDPATLPTFASGETTFKDGVATVAATATLSAQMSATLGVSELPVPCVLVKEGRAWKVDLTATDEARQKAMEELTKKLMGAMGNPSAPAPTP